MKVTPLEIRQKQFHLRFRGFDMNEVDAFLELITEEMESLIRENMGLKEELERRDAAIQELKEEERTLKEALVMTQQVVEEMKTNARREAEVILKEAEMQAERIVAQAREQSVQLMAEIAELKRQKKAFLEKFRGLLDLHQKLLSYEEREDEGKPASNAALPDERLSAAGGVTG